MLHETNSHGIHFSLVGAAGSYFDVVLHDYRCCCESDQGGASRRHEE